MSFLFRLPVISQLDGLTTKVIQNKVLPRAPEGKLLHEDMERDPSPSPCQQDKLQTKK